LVSQHRRTGPQGAFAKRPKHEGREEHEGHEEYTRVLRALDKGFDCAGWRRQPAETKRQQKTHEEQAFILHVFSAAVSFLAPVARSRSGVFEIFVDRLCVSAPLFGIQLFASTGLDPGAPASRR
jgi:hypothetical protein